MPREQTPYVFWDGGTRCEVRITRSWCVKDVALEISEGVWGSTNRTKYIRKHIRIEPAAPRSGIEYLLQDCGQHYEEEPSESQKKLMIAWLLQNRTQKMVEERAYELVYELADEFENIQVVIHEGYMALFVRGIHADWMIADANKGWKQGHQNVNTYYWDGRKWTGPICIDNLHHNSSIGDQLSSRAMMLMNDKGAGERYTHSGATTNTKTSGTASTATTEC